MARPTDFSMTRAVKNRLSFTLSNSQGKKTVVSNLDEMNLQNWIGRGEIGPVFLVRCYMDHLLEVW